MKGGCSFIAERKPTEGWVSSLRLEVTQEKDVKNLALIMDVMLLGTAF